VKKWVVLLGKQHRKPGESWKGIPGGRMPDAPHYEKKAASFSNGHHQGVWLGPIMRKGEED